MQGFRFITRATPINEIMDELTYSSYSAQRLMFPETPANSWARLYGDTTARECEARFQAEFFPEVVN